MVPNDKLSEPQAWIRPRIRVNFVLFDSFLSRDYDVITFRVRKYFGFAGI